MDRRAAQLRRLNWDTETCTGPARAGKISTLVWLREEGCPWSAPVCATAAASNGRLAVLEWLREREKEECPWNEDVCEAAAGYGDLAVLQWLREEVECPWDGRSCAVAVENGHLDVLVYIYENGGEYKEPRFYHERCREFLEDYAIPFWSKGIRVTVGHVPKPARRT